MKKLFLTGLAILLPVVVTIIVIGFIVNILTAPFLGVVEGILIHYDLLDHKFLFFSGKQVLLLSSKILILLGLVASTLLIGFVARFFFVHYLFRFGDYLIHKIPLINKIYKATQDVVHTLFNKEKTSFSQVVLVPFPHSNSYCIGLITSNLATTGLHKDEFISVFVPGTPNPTMGFVLLFKQDQMINVDMGVDDAFKFIVSCGVIFSGFTKEKPLS